MPAPSVTKARHDGRAPSARETWLTAALDSSAEGVSVWDADDRLVYCNDRFRDAYPTIAHQLIPGVDLKGALRKAVKAGQLRIDGPADQWIEDHTPGRGSDGGVREQRLDDGRWLLATERRTADGGLVWTVSDVTEHKLTEETLALLTRAVEESPSIVVITDPAGVIEYVNPRFTQATGYDADDVIGHNIAILKSRKTSLKDYKRVWATLATGEPWRGRQRLRRIVPQRLKHQFEIREIESRRRGLRNRHGVRRSR